MPYSKEMLARHNLGQTIKHLQAQGVPDDVIRAALIELAEAVG